MYRSSPLRSTLNTGYITGLDMCKVCTEAVHCTLWTCVQVQKNVIIPTPPHPTPPYHMWCVRGWLWVEKMMQNCACVYLWLQSVCAGDSGKWRCARVTPVCVRRWLWVEKMMRNCACVYLWLQSVCAGDPLTYFFPVFKRQERISIHIPSSVSNLRVCVYVFPPKS